mgnify:CR=1 FL=1
MKKLILGCLLALFASGCNDNEPEQKPVELKISFAGENPVEFTVGEQKRLAFTVTGDDLEGLTFAAEPDEALSGWTVVVSAGREGDAYAGALDVTASATPSETAVTLTVTDRNGKPWSATTPTLTAVQAPVTAIDLSRDGTANCYIVSEAGDYMFDAAVRGNGSGDNAAIALADGMKADWLWVTKGLEQEISAVSLDAGKGRIFFTAAGAAKGNAVIALADAAGEIVWSWHLWFTPEPRMVTYANGRVLLDRSLGAVGTTPGSAEAYGLYYQWGRKDPFIGPSTYKISSGQGAAMYNDSGSRTYVTMVASSAETGTMDYAVKHPLAFVTGVAESNNDWLWSKSDAGWSSDGDAGAKSVNDPCPYGWRVAPSAAFAGLEIVGTPAAGDEEKFGWTLTDGKAESFFMGGGRRRYDDGKIQNIYIPKDEAKMKLYTRADIAQPWEGLYWTTAVDGTQSNALHFWYEKLTGTGGIAPAEAYARANGMQVRCVKVENM